MLLVTDNHKNYLSAKFITEICLFQLIEVWNVPGDFLKTICSVSDFAHSNL